MPLYMCIINLIDVFMQLSKCVVIQTDKTNTTKLIRH